MDTPYILCNECDHVNLRRVKEWPFIVADPVLTRHLSVMTSPVTKDVVIDVAKDRVAELFAVLYALTELASKVPFRWMPIVKTVFVVDKTYAPSCNIKYVPVDGAITVISPVTTYTVLLVVAVVKLFIAVLVTLPLPPCSP